MMRKPVVLAVEDEKWRQERIAKAVGDRARVVYIGHGSQVIGFLERTVPNLVLLDHDLEDQGTPGYRSGTHIADWLARRPLLRATSTRS